RRTATVPSLDLPMGRAAVEGATVGRARGGEDAPPLARVADAALPGYRALAVAATSAEPAQLLHHHDRVLALVDVVVGAHADRAIVEPPVQLEGRDVAAPHFERHERRPGLHRPPLRLGHEELRDAAAPML